MDDSSLAEGHTDLTTCDDIREQLASDFLTGVSDLGILKGYHFSDIAIKHNLEAIVALPDQDKDWNVRGKSLTDFSALKAVPRLFGNLGDQSLGCELLCKCHKGGFGRFTIISTGAGNRVHTWEDDLADSFRDQCGALAESLDRTDDRGWDSAVSQCTADIKHLGRHREERARFEENAPTGLGTPIAFTIPPECNQSSGGLRFVAKSRIGTDTSDRREERSFGPQSTDDGNVRTHYGHPFSTGRVGPEANDRRWRTASSFLPQASSESSLGDPESSQPGIIRTI